MELPPATSSSSNSSSSGETESGPPVEKKLKTSTDEEDTETSAGSLTTGSPLDDKVTSKASRTKPKVMVTSKGTITTKGTLQYSRQRTLEKTPKEVSKLGLGSIASSVVQKTSQELKSSFKSAETDKNAREAYKALFHSADKERPKDKRSHWVTFFPYH